MANQSEKSQAYDILEDSFFYLDEEGIEGFLSNVDYEDPSFKKVFAEISKAAVEASSAIETLRTVLDFYRYDH